ncbi:MAG: HNH endonuclease, partial [Acidobacteriota bacterium]|nr:HNH endonuclease [Acidobacteriota bacterium]
MFKKDVIYNRRKDLHEPFGGNQQSGIASCNKHPYVFLFSAPAGEEFGYKDGWISDEEFVYTGEGQRGDMQFVRGNRAIQDHLANGKQLHLFEHYRMGEYKYLGEFQYR